MQKLLYSILFIFLFIPMLVNASSYSNATSTANKYINNFLNSDRYFKTNSGDLITKSEVEKTIVRKDKDNKPLTISSYMFDGTRFWAKDSYIIAETIEKKTGGNGGSGIIVIRNKR